MVAVTVRVYVPAAVLTEPDPPPPPPPPHDTINVISSKGNIAHTFRPTRCDGPTTGSNTMPIRAIAQVQTNEELFSCRAALVGAVVVTVALNVAAVVALTVSLLGTEQLAAVGAPVQVSVAIPLTPWPPIDNV